MENLWKEEPGEKIYFRDTWTMTPNTRRGALGEIGRAIGVREVGVLLTESRLVLPVLPFVNFGGSWRGLELPVDGLKSARMVRVRRGALRLAIGIAFLLVAAWTTRVMLRGILWWPAIGLLPILFTAIFANRNYVALDLQTSSGLTRWRVPLAEKMSMDEHVQMATVISETLDVLEELGVAVDRLEDW